MKKIFVNLKDWMSLKDNEKYVSDIKNENIVVFPSLTYIHLYSNVKNIEVGAQNVSPFESGPHTGSICANHLKDLNVKWILLNHRDCKNHDRELLTSKIKESLINEMKIIFCINEISDEDFEILARSFDGSEPDGRIYIAYESEKELSHLEASSDIEKINKFCYAKFGKKYPILYGGNISKDNIDNYLDLPVEGFLISRHALDTNELKTIINLVK